jgi:hypothetical protein
MWATIPRMGYNLPCIISAKARNRRELPMPLSDETIISAVKRYSREFDCYEKLSKLVAKNASEKSFVQIRCVPE